MSETSLRLIVYLLFSLLAGVIVTEITDIFENITIEKSLRRELEQEIRMATASYMKSAKAHTSEEIVNFITEFTNSALEGKVTAVKHAPEETPPPKSAFLFTYEAGGEKRDFYISTPYLREELANLDLPELIFGLIMTIVVFTSLVLYMDKKNQLTALNHQFKRVVAEQEALVLLGRMVATLAHELQTPVATISNLVQLLPAREGDAKFSNRFVALMTGELNRIQQLISCLLLDGKEIQVEMEEWIPFLPFIEEIARKNALHLEMREGIDLYGDRFLLHLLFDNLMRNSKNEDADTIRITVRRGSVPPLSTEIIVEDNGHGFPADKDANSFFDPFVTGHSKGAGLGLYLVKRIAMAHGGEVSLHTIAGGAGIRLSLPEQRVLSHE